jgi:hypothetical protein
MKIIEYRRAEPGRSVWERLWYLACYHLGGRTAVMTLLVSVVVLLTIGTGAIIFWPSDSSVKVPPPPDSISGWNITGADYHGRSR